MTFDELAERGMENFILRETEAPAGYRKNADLKLKYTKGTENEDQQTDPEFSGHLIADGGSNWETGSWAGVGLRVKAPNVLYATKADNAYEQGEKIGTAEDDYNGGAMFAAVLYFTGDGSKTEELQDESKWRTVSGNSVDGWTVGDDASMENIVKFAKQDGHVFSVQQGTGGAYAATFEELPGYLENYYNYITRLGGKDYSKVKFTIAYYWTSASSIDDANASNTERVWMGGTRDANTAFIRQFTVQLYVPNLMNYLIVQKTDESFDPLFDQEGKQGLTADFALYAEDQMVYDDDGKPTGVRDGETPYDTATAKHREEGEPSQYQLYLQSGAAFPSEGKVLVNGTYYLVESSAPTGYIKSDQITKVMVTDDGVFADAGAAGDDVRVLNGVGTLVKNMMQFASGSAEDVDLTLRDVTATQLTTDQEAMTGESWTKTGKELDLTYKGGDSSMEYIPTGSEGAASLGDITVSNDVGWSRLEIKQNLAEGVRKMNLGDLSLNRLFSGVTIVQVRNSLGGSLSVRKLMAEGDAPVVAGQEFTMEVTLKSVDGVTPLSGSYKAAIVDADGNPVGDVFELALDKDGKAEVKLQVGQRVVIGIGDGRLPVGARFSVKETGLSGDYKSPSYEVEGGTGTVGDNGATGMVPACDDPAANGYALELGVRADVTNRTVAWGLTVLKRDAKSGEALPGAAFTVYRANEAGEFEESEEFEAALFTDADLGGVASWPEATGKDGMLALHGFESSAEGATYYLVETKAPAGYQRKADPVKLTFTRNDAGNVALAVNGQDAGAAKDHVFGITVDNTRVPTLPQTGGVGNGPLYVLGAVCLGGAAYAITRMVEGRRTRR